MLVFDPGTNQVQISCDIQGCPGARTRFNTNGTWDEVWQAGQELADWDPVAEGNLQHPTMYRTATWKALIPQYRAWSVAGAGTFALCSWHNN